MRTRFEGHEIRVRERWRGDRAYVVVEVTFPSGRKRELWAEPPTSSGLRAGPARTRRVEVRSRDAELEAKKKRTTIRRTNL